jgi:hypothetical protein
MAWSQVTNVCAVVGAGLGIFNFARAYWRDKVRLKVTLKLAEVRQGGFYSSTVEVLPKGFACIGVVNLSVFAVTVEEVGFFMADSVQRLVIIPDPKNLLPYRLEPRQSMDFKAVNSAGFPGGSRRAFAKTQCGYTGYGDSPVFKKFRETPFSTGTQS